MFTLLAAGAALAALAFAIARGLGPQAPYQLGFASLIAMVSVYIGARLVSGKLGDVLIEAAIAASFVLAALIASARWSGGVGAVILAHGAYDWLLGAQSGVTAWYPPFCAGFDLAAGAALMAWGARANRAA